MNFTGHPNAIINAFTVPIAADGAGVDGEGLQIGEGEVDFKELFDILNGCNATFVPEIWQGHKFDGEGFWIALERLSKYNI